MSSLQDNPERLITAIREMVDTLGAQEMDTLSGDTLSRFAVKLASYKASLGVFVVDSKHEVYKAEANYQLARAEGYQRCRDEGKGTTDAAELKHLHAADALSELNEAKYTNDRVTQLSKDCHDLIDGLKSRLINLQTERSESNVS